MTLADDSLLLKQLLASPKLPQYLREIEQRLADERRERQSFYEQITEGEKVEFINGYVVHHSPVKLRHNEAAQNLQVLLRTFVRLNDLGLVGLEKLMISLTRNDYEPDICFFRKEVAATFSPDQMRFPAPDFIAEILSESTEGTDRGIKMEDYAAHHVGEYWIIDPSAETVEQYLLREDQYELAVKVKTGLVESKVVSGFQIPVRALFDEGENQAALKALMQ